MSARHIEIILNQMPRELQTAATGRGFTGLVTPRRGLWFCMWADARKAAEYRDGLGLDFRRHGLKRLLEICWHDSPAKVKL